MILVDHARKYWTDPSPLPPPPPILGSPLPAFPPPPFLKAQGYRGGRETYMQSLPFHVASFLPLPGVYSSGILPFLVFRLPGMVWPLRIGIASHLRLKQPHPCSLWVSKYGKSHRELFLNVVDRTVYQTPGSCVGGFRRFSSW
jgi:hypothetical protein